MEIGLFQHDATGDSWKILYLLENSFKKQLPHHPDEKAQKIINETSKPNPLKTIC
jgi:hypothetical protein